MGATVAIVVLSSCGISPEIMGDSETAMQAESAGRTSAVDNYAGDVAAESMPAPVPAPVPEMPQAQPQLAKRANIVVVVTSVEDGVEQVVDIARSQQGDLLSLNDQIPQSVSERQTATLQIRIPQDKLEPTLEALADLGTVERRSISAEDVSNQLIDLQARLRNLRRTEEMLLEIMERSGSVGDVLNVAKEVSNVRSSIEQIDAQLKSLQNRVSYSTIDVQLQAAIASTTPQRNLGEQLQGTWQVATHSVQDFSITLVKLLLWLLAYSPYLLVVAMILGIAWRLRSRQRIRAATSNDAE
jgi:hypothetical protein